MPKKIALIGHCGPDSSYLRIAVSKAVKGAQIVAADDESELESLVKGGVDLLLFNRVLDFGFSSEEGVELIRRLHERHPDLRMMLVSNYPEAQQQAVDAGALPGFGKGELGTARVTELLRSALQEA